MCFDFNVETVGQFQNPCKPLTGFKRLQIEEEVSEPMTLRQPAILPAAIEAIQAALLSWSEGKVSANDNAGRKKLLPRDVCAEMHVVMAIHATWRNAKQALILFKLHFDDILKRISEAGMIKHRRKPVRTQETRELFLVLLKPRRTMRR
jgi:hypothetical protein